MTLQRATVEWKDDETYPDDTFYFLSPDGEDWLEVTAESYHRAPDHEADVIDQLQAELEGRDGTMRIRMTRRYLMMQGQIPGRSVTFA